MLTGAKKFETHWSMGWSIGDFIIKNLSIIDVAIAISATTDDPAWHIFEVNRLRSLGLYPPTLSKLGSKT